MQAIVLWALLTISSVSLGLVEFPKSCLAEQSPDCHFGTVKKTSKYRLGEMQIYLGQETLLRRNNGVLEWIHGPVLFEVEARSDIQVRNHRVSLQKGKYLFFGDEYSFKVEVLDGHFSLDSFPVTEGFLATFKFNGIVADIEPLQAIDFKEHLVRYIKVKNLTKEQAQEYADELKPKHANYVIWLDELNQKLTKRSIAREESMRRKQVRTRERARLEEEKRKLDFFNKVFER